MASAADSGDDPPAQELVVHLHRGWGVRVRVQDEQGHAVAGVPVLLDGQPAGTTDASGTLEARSPLRPLVVGVGGAWKLAPGGMVHPESGAFGNPFPELLVVLARR